MARKQFLSFLLIFSLLISCASALAEADDDDDWDDNVDDAWEMEHPLHSGDYAYALLDDGTVEITSYGGADTEIVIPDTLDGKPVTAIGERASALPQRPRKPYISHPGRHRRHQRLCVL